MIAVTFPMDALSEQRVAVRPVHECMLTNIELNPTLLCVLIVPERAAGNHSYTGVHSGLVGILLRLRPRVDASSRPSIVATKGAWDDAIKQGKVYTT